MAVLRRASTPSSRLIELIAANAEAQSYNDLLTRIEAAPALGAWTSDTAEPADQGKGQNNGKRHGKFASDFANQAQTTDPTKCDYWRYCSSDGYLCACCERAVAVRDYLHWRVHLRRGWVR